MSGVSEPGSVFTKQQRIANLARENPQMGLTSLNHHLDLAWLWHALEQVNLQGAAGVDGQTALDYLAESDETLPELLERAKSGSYRAPPVRRVDIPKEKGKTRSLGIPTLEDKVLQRAVVNLLEPIYEEDFLECSYGYRPGRSAQQALAELKQQLSRGQGCWLLEVDIQQFFDTLDHAHLRAFVKKRVRDGVILRLIDKWLSAGVLHRGCLSYPEAGTPQGGVVSPLLANVYLHYVLDEWFEEEVKPRMKGRVFLIRYADDFVIGFEHEEEARRVQEVLVKRMAKYGLKLHPEKTRLVDFRSPGSDREESSQGSVSKSFDFLGMTHYWQRSWGRWGIRQKTARDRISRGLRRLSEWMRRHLHRSIIWQCNRLNQKLLGHYQYYGVAGNSRQLWTYRYHVVMLWQKWLGRRKRSGRIPWPKMANLLRWCRIRTPKGYCRA